MNSNYLHIISSLHGQAELIAVSKYHPASAIKELYALGQRKFGESRAQELVEKARNLPEDIEWHFIGHLQRTNVKYIAPFVSLIHAVDSLKLLEEINKQAAKHNRTIPCLLQIHIAQEETKFGFTFNECRAMLEESSWKKLEHIRLTGMMCMASNTDNEAQIQHEFAQVNAFFHEIKSAYFPEDSCFNIRSWGMSDDYLIAIQEGSNMVRIGSALFGERQ